MQVADRSLKKNQMDGAFGAVLPMLLFTMSDDAEKKNFERLAKLIQLARTDSAEGERIAAINLMLEIASKLPNLHEVRIGRGMVVPYDHPEQNQQVIQKQLHGVIRHGVGGNGYFTIRHNARVNASRCERDRMISEATRSGCCSAICQARLAPQSWPTGWNRRCHSPIWTPPLRPFPTPFRQGGDAVPGVRSNTPSVQIPSLWPLAIIGSPSRPRTLLLFTSIRVCAAHHDTDGVPVTRFTSFEVW